MAHLNIAASQSYAESHSSMALTGEGAGPEVQPVISATGHVKCCLGASLALVGQVGGGEGGCCWRGFYLMRREQYQQEPRQPQK